MCLSTCFSRVCCVPQNESFLRPWRGGDETSRHAVGCGDQPTTVARASTVFPYQEFLFPSRLNTQPPKLLPPPRRLMVAQFVQATS
jgi:hypothetical protein